MVFVFDGDGGFRGVVIVVRVRGEGSWDVRANGLALPVCAAGRRVELVGPDELDATRRGGHFRELVVGNLRVEVAEEGLGELVLGFGKGPFCFAVRGHLGLVLLLGATLPGCYGVGEELFPRGVLVVPVVDKLLAPEGVGSRVVWCGWDSGEFSGGDEARTGFGWC